MKRSYLSLASYGETMDNEKKVKKLLVLWIATNKIISTNGQHNRKIMIYWIIISLTDDTGSLE